MKMLRFLGSSGDRAIRFDTSHERAGARVAAQDLFERLLAQGSIAFKVHRTNGRRDEKVTELSALENETIVVPRVVGG